MLDKSNANCWKIFKEKLDGAAKNKILSPEIISDRTNLNEILSASIDF